MESGEIFAEPMRDHDDNIHDACGCHYKDSKYAAYSYFIKVENFGQENFGESPVIRQNILPPKFCIVRYVTGTTIKKQVGNK